MKFIVTKKNTQHGIVVNPIADDIYPHVINFPNPDLRDEYINSFLFNEGDDYKVLLENSKEFVVEKFDSKSSTFTVFTENIGFTGLQAMLNADYGISIEDGFYYFWQIKGTYTSKGKIHYNVVLDVFFTYLSLIQINGKVKITRAHVDRQRDGVWVDELNSPTYNQFEITGKKYENATIPLNIKDTGNTLYDELKNQVGGKLYYGVIVRKLGTNVNSEIIRNVRMVFENREITSPYSFTIYPLNFGVTTTGAPGITIDSLKFGSDLATADQNVEGAFITDYDFVDWNNNNGVGSISKKSDLLYTFASGSSGGIDNENGACTNIAVWEDERSGFKAGSSLQVLYYDFAWLKPFNTFELDLTAYQYDPLKSNRDNEISSYQSGGRDITINVVGNSEGYLVPQKYFGQKLNITHIINVDSSELSEVYQIDNIINANLYEGLTKENTAYVNWVDDYSTNYKNNNKNGLFFKKISIALEMLAGGLLMAKGKLGAATALEVSSLSNASSLEDIKRQPNTIKGSVNASLKDFIFFKYSLGIYANEIKVIGNNWEVLADEIYMYGVTVNELRNYNDIKESREVFNYVQAEDIYNKISGDIRLSAENKKLIANSFKNGLTLWHYRSKDTWGGILDYDKANNEY